jgi:hypothetical protein
VQNKAKLGGTGAYGQRPSSCGARPGRRVKRAKRTQFGPACSVPVRAWGSMGILRAAGPRAGCACCEETPDGVTTNVARVQNEPNLALAPGNGRGLAGLRCPGGVRLCKTNPIPGGAGRDGAPGTWDAGQMRKTNPICPPGGSPSPLDPPGSGPPKAVVQNEPNLPGGAGARCSALTGGPAGGTKKVQAAVLSTWSG